jgi:hypothetical protein
MAGGYSSRSLPGWVGIPRSALLPVLLGVLTVEGGFRGLLLVHLLVAPPGGAVLGFVDVLRRLGVFVLVHLHPHGGAAAVDVVRGVVGLVAGLGGLADEEVLRGVPGSVEGLATVCPAELTASRPVASPMSSSRSPVASPTARVRSPANLPTPTPTSSTTSPPARTTSPTRSLPACAAHVPATCPACSTVSVARSDRLGC